MSTDVRWLRCIRIVEILEFYFDNNIILCRLLFHTSYKLHPRDFFAPLKNAYHEQVERIERGGVGKIGRSISPLCTVLQD